MALGAVSCSMVWPTPHLFSWEVGEGGERNNASSSFLYCFKTLSNLVIIYNYIDIFKSNNLYNDAINLMILCSGIIGRVTVSGIIGRRVS